MTKSTPEQAGFTLVEIMIWLTATGLLLAALVPLFSTSIVLWHRSSSQSEVQQTAHFAVDSMVRELKFGSSIVKVNDNELSFTDSQGRRSGYQLNTTNHILYNLLSNNNPQPVTGVNIQNSTNVLIYGDFGASKALFDVQGQTVFLSLRAVDAVTGQGFTVHTAVTGISEYLK